MDDEQKEAKSTSPEPTQMERRHSKGRHIMNRIMNPFSSGNNSSTKLSHIQSAAMTDDDKTKSLAVFKLEGLDLATTRTDAFMQDSWADPKHGMKMTDKPAQKPDESPKRKAPPRPPLPLHKSFEDSDKHRIQKAPLEQRLSVQPTDHLLHKPRRPVQRSHSSAGSTNLVKREEPNVVPPAVAPRNHRPTSQLPQGLKKPMIPPPKRSSTKAHNHEGIGSSEQGQRKGSPPMMPRDPNHRPVSPNTREVTEKGT